MFDVTVTEMEDHSRDLPLMSNVDDIEVFHYVLDLSCNFRDKEFVGSATLFCCPAGSSRQQGEDEGTRSEKDDTGTCLVENTVSRVCPCTTGTEQKRNSVTSVVKIQGECACSYTSDSLIQTSGKDAAGEDCCSCVDSSKFSTETSDHTDHELSSKTGCQCDFQMVLDCWRIQVLKVEEIPPTEGLVTLEELRQKTVTRTTLYKLSKGQGTELGFQCEERCLRIWKPGVLSPYQFPNIIRIQYNTHPEGQSLKWTRDQDGNQCVFTHGHWINNRSLFPSQDVPVAMATWQADIHASSGELVVMSGDSNPTVNKLSDERIVFHFYTDMVMPSSTLALAVGSWCVHQVIPADCLQTQADSKSENARSQGQLPCRLITPEKFQDQAKNVIQNYIPACMNAIVKLLGPHPFKRLDILIVPDSFSSLGMASPSVTFMSQSLLGDDRMMCTRLAHEMSHSWFGLLIGPRDWTEEWLSEGFATYTEGYIHSTVMGWDSQACEEQAEIRDYLRYTTLKSESECTEDQLQTLRPNKGEQVNSGKDNVMYIRNGMNPDKGFTQVHYLKGFFLLKMLEELSGREKFHQFMRLFVETFYGKLITSQDFLSLFFQEFPNLHEEGYSVTKINDEWLDTASIPKAVQSYGSLRTENSLARQAFTQVKHLQNLNNHYRSVHWQKRRKMDLPSSLVWSKCEPVVVLLILEELIKVDSLHPDILMTLRDAFKLDQMNAEVQHRWCELVVQNKLKDHYKDVELFLKDHQVNSSLYLGRFCVQKCLRISGNDKLLSRWASYIVSRNLSLKAMGVYLFGELILSRDKTQRRLAERCFQALSADMEEGVHYVVHSMIYGS